MLRILAALIVAFFLAVPLRGQTIVYSYDGSTATPVISGEDFTVNVGSVTGTKILRIYDPSFGTLPDNDAGKITISGSLGTNGQLLILVAGPSQTWPTLIQTALTAVGLRHLGVDSADGIVVTDADLRAKTRLSAFVSGDVRGEIELGQIRRVQSGTPGTTPTGIISASLTSVAGNIQLGELGFESAMGYIIAGDAVTGAVTAELGDIEQIQVGPSATADGISGNILTEAGAIKSIYSTGPIGNGTTTPMTIIAAKGIGQIRTVNADTGVLLDRDVEGGRGTEVLSAELGRTRGSTRATDLAARSVRRAGVRGLSSS